MGAFGNQLGSFLGGMAGRRFGKSDNAQKLGEGLGGLAGSYLPFKKGGLVKGKKGKPVKALLHGGEYVLPASVKPTKAQKAKVAELKKPKKAKK